MSAYKGPGQAMNDLVAGHVPLGSLTWTAAIGQIRNGTVIPLAVSSSKRMPGFPDVPTLKELGNPDLTVTTWFGFAAPAGVPGSDRRTHEPRHRQRARRASGP